MAIKPVVGSCIKAGVKLMPVFLVANVEGRNTYKIHEDTPKGYVSRNIVASDFPTTFYGQFRSTKS